MSSCYSLQIGGLISGIQLGMASGEAGTLLITKNVLLSVTNNLITSTGYLSISTPASQEASDLNTIQPKLTLGKYGLSACPFTGGYANLAVMQWTKNPFDHSNAVASPLLRMSSSRQAAATASKSRSTNTTTGRRTRMSRRLSSMATSALTTSPSRSPTMNSKTVKSVAPSSAPSTIKLTSARMHVPEDPAYTVSLQFSSPQDFNFSASSNYTSGVRSTTTSNFSLPACVQFNGVKYIPCQGCNISSYTNYNVTYSCYDITQICPSSSSNQRVLSNEYEPQHKNSAGGYIIDVDDSGDWDDDWNDDEDGGEYWIDDKDGSEYWIDEKDEYAYDYEVLEWVGEKKDKEGESHGDASHRHLQAVPVDDDGAAVTKAPAATYGMLIESILAEMTSVLSINPFAINLAQSKVILGFVGGFSTFILIMLFFLLRLDYFDRLKKKYGTPDSVAAARLVIENRLKNGGKDEGGGAFKLGPKVSECYLTLEFRCDVCAVCS